MRVFASLLLVPLLLLVLIQDSQGEAKQQTESTWFGVSQPGKSLTLSPEASGLICSLPVEEGDVVSQGQTLLALVDRLEVLQVQRLKTLAENTSQEEEARSRLAYARIEFTRIETMVSEDVGTRAQLAAAQLERDLREIALKQALLDQEIAGVRYEEANAQLAQRRIISPIDGVVARLYLEVGESIQRFQAVMDVVTLNPLLIELNCPIRDASLFKEGQQVSIRRDHSPGEARIGQVIHAGRRADASSHTFPVRIRLANPKPQWKAGLKVRIVPK
jgi:RND family efflux transporter MFP subunit